MHNNAPVVEWHAQQSHTLINCKWTGGSGFGGIFICSLKEKQGSDFCQIWWYQVCTSEWMFVGCFVARKYSETLGGAAHNLYMILMMFISNIHLLLLLHLSSFSLIDSWLPPFLFCACKHRIPVSLSGISRNPSLGKPGFATWRTLKENRIVCTHLTPDTANDRQSPQLSEGAAKQTCC